MYIVWIELCSAWRHPSCGCPPLRECGDHGRAGRLGQQDLLDVLAVVDRHLVHLLQD